MTAIECRSGLFSASIWLRDSLLQHDYECKSELWSAFTWLLQEIDLDSHSLQWMMQSLDLLSLMNSFISILSLHWYSRLWGISRDVNLNITRWRVTWRQSRSFSCTINTTKTNRNHFVLIDNKMIKNEYILLIFMISIILWIFKK